MSEIHRLPVQPFSFLEVHVRRLVEPRLSFFSAALALAALGCFQDFDQFRPGEGGGGGGGGDACDNVDCNDDNPCTQDICNAGTCEHPAAAVFTVPQTAGDCKEATCEGTEVVQDPDEDDTPADDGNPCTTEECNGDMPVFPNVPVGTTCNETGQCSEDGLCSTCLDDDDCGTDTDCADVSCGDDGECEAVFNVGDVISGDDDGDCDALICVDNELQPQELFFADDIEDDQNLCTTDTCDMEDGPVHTPVAPNEPCDDDIHCNGEDTCNASGVCEHAGDPCEGGTECNSTCNEEAETCFDAMGTNCGDAATACSGQDTCNGAGVCQPNHSASTVSCNDGQFCTATDMCNGSGACVGAGNPCMGGDACNDTCNEAMDNCFDAMGSNCGSGPTDCSGQDTCNGMGTCQPNHLSNVTLCTSNGMFCDGVERCNGSGTCISPGNPCTGGGECNNSCNEAADNCFSLPGTNCGSAATTCSGQDTCNGSGTCSPNHLDTSTMCGSQADTDCSNPDRCDGAGACSPMNEPITTPCDAMGVDNPTDNTTCTDPDTCNGMGMCSGNHAPAGTDCGPGGNDDCDGAGTCVP